MKKNLVLFFTIKEFEEVHLYKDVGLVPYYLCKEYDLNGKIVYSNEIKKELPKQFRSLKLEEIKFIKFPKLINKIDKFKILENISFYIYLLKNAKKIDYLMLFHYGLDKYFILKLYKLLNKHGKIYIKFDTEAKYKVTRKKNFLKNYFLKDLNKIKMLFSIETTSAYERILNENPFGLKEEKLLKNLFYLPNGFDENYLEENKIKIKNFEEKENLMITVGRLGTKEKNNELLLEALEKIELKNWKVLLIGPYTEEFKKLYNNFIEKNQDKKDKVILIGNINNKELLYDYYNRAKVFILTSRWESYGLVLVEALRFGNFIITTDVGAARDITFNNRIGRILNSSESKVLNKSILECIQNQSKLKENYNLAIKLAKEKFLWNKIIKNKNFKCFFYGND